MKKDVRFIAIALLVSLIVVTTGANVAVAETTAPANTADTTEPSDVENLQAQAGNGEVSLIWSPATDNVGVIGYKIYRGTRSVKSEGQVYDLPVIPIGALTRHVVKNLTNGQTYYLTITAVDAAGNESVNYATEVQTTPQGAARAASIEDNGKAPQVKELTSEDIVTVLVVFSEPIQLPAENSENSFRVEKSDDKSRLTIQQATIDQRDPSGATVILTTAPQQAGAKYILTAGLGLQDYYGNPIISGTSDTGLFEGSAKKKTDSKEPDDSGTQAPKIIDAKADFADRMSVTFSKEVVLSKDAKETITITKKGTEQKLAVKNANLSVDGKTVYITTETQAPVEYEIVFEGISDAAGNELEELQKVTVTGKGVGIRDLIPPEDITNLLGKIKDIEKGVVELRWKASKNTAQDLADQLLYQSSGRNTNNFGQPIPLGPSVTSAEVQNLQPGWYTFKITAKDTSGNESKGTIRSLYLPETGPGMLAAGVTGLIMALYRRRKKK